MDKNGFAEFLKERGGRDERIEDAMAIAEAFETFLAEGHYTIATDAQAVQTVHAFSKRLIERDLNTWDNYVALLRYGRFIGNDAVLIAALELIDGAEALERLHEKLAEAHGAVVCDRIFEGIEIPVLGVPNADKPCAMAAVIRRIEERLGHDACIDLLKDSVRYLDDAWYEDGKAKYERAGGIDAFLEQKGRDFIALMEKHRDEGTLFFSQPINDAVIDYVNAHPEIRSGVREGTGSSRRRSRTRQSSSSKRPIRSTRRITTVTVRGRRNRSARVRATSLPCSAIAVPASTRSRTK